MTETKRTPGPWAIEESSMGDDGKPLALYVVQESADDWYCVAASFADVNEADIRLIAAAPEMDDLIAEFGDAATDVFEQMNMGNWVDDNGHAVQMNQQMSNLKDCVLKAITLRAKVKGETK